KGLAKELGLPIVALSQLNRKVEERKGGKPVLSDLRESGAIEQDADVVMFVFREEYYLMRTPPTQRPEESQEKFNDRIEKHRQRCEEVYGLAEIHVAKQRHGPIGKVTLRFDGNTTKFDNYVSGDRLPDAF
ncbi:MAG TPA: DnaB-like helicase C-terminal domain-containing protein, partial [Stellaceae bacterium]|nr:DnaB-like helicase C-terminal domain-containing protein [Stellaceae bacterium]